MNRYSVHNQILCCISSSFVIQESVPVPNFEFPREEWHEDELREGHHEGDYCHVDADLGYPKLELRPEKPNMSTFWRTVEIHFQLRA